MSDSIPTNGASGMNGTAATPTTAEAHYKWLALSNTTLGILMATINSSIVLIAMPDIFRGIKLNPLAPGNTSYLLWLLMGFMVCTAVLLVSFGRIGDMYGRVKMFTLGFAIFSIFSVLLSVTWLCGCAVADLDARRPGGRRCLLVR
jgi:MFS family permease